MSEIQSLEKYCSSESLSLIGIKCAMEYFVPHDFLDDSDFLHRVCLNPKVTLDIVEYLVGLCPEASYNECEINNAQFYATESYPLHMALLNEDCPNSVIEFLLKRRGENYIDELSMNCYPMGSDHLADMSTGFPLHLYLSRKVDVDIEIVKQMIEGYPDALLIASNGLTPLKVLMRNPKLGSMFDVFKYLVESEPKSIENSLTFACLHDHITVEIVQYILRKCPEEASRKDDHDRLPLHSLCGNRMATDASIEILKILLNTYPEGTAQAWSYRSRSVLPIHEAVSTKSLEFCKLLINANPELIRIQDGQHARLPIHYASSSGYFDVVKHLYELYPDSIRTMDRSGRYPFHYACNNPNPMVLKYIHELYPGAIDLMTNSGYLAIHEAVYPRTNISTNKCIKTKNIEFLISHDPDCLSKTTNDYYRFLPLHLACNPFGEKTPQLDEVEFLFNLYPEAILESDGRRNLPIDVVEACRQTYGLQSEAQSYAEIIAFLGTQQNYARMATNTYTMTTPDGNGWLPLHHALNNNAPLGSIKLLVKGNPDAIQLSDNQGLLPIQIACELCSAEVVKFLTSTIDDCFTIRDHNKNYLLHYACRGGNIDVVRHLLKAGHTRSVCKKNKDGMLPIHLLNEFVKERWCEENDTKYVEALWLLLLAEPETVHPSNWNPLPDYDDINADGDNDTL
eukprot:scaffold13204_cov66-Cyclotella_meneghiniana.AAC.6